MKIPGEGDCRSHPPPLLVQLSELAQRGPARKSVLASDDKLGFGQSEVFKRQIEAGQARKRLRSATANRLEQRLCLILEMTQARSRGEEF